MRQLGVICIGWDACGQQYSIDVPHNPVSTREMSARILSVVVPRIRLFPDAAKRHYVPLRVSTVTLDMPIRTFQGQHPEAARGLDGCALRLSSHGVGDDMMFRPKV